MTIIASTGFESGTVGSSVPTDSSDFYDAGTATGTASCTYSGDHPVAGSKGALFACGTGSGYVTRTRTFTAAAVGSYRAYLRFDSAPAANVAIASFYSGTTKVADLRHTTTGGLQIRDVSTAVGTELAVPLDTDVRVEWKVDPGGTQSLQIHHGANLHSETASGSTSGTADGTAATTVDELRTGIASFNSGYSYWADEVAVGNTDFCGPVATTTAGVTISWPAAAVTIDAPDMEGGIGDTIIAGPIRIAVVGGLWDVSANTGTGTRVDIASPAGVLDLVGVAPAWVGAPRRDGLVVEALLDGAWVDLTPDLDPADVVVHYGRSGRWEDVGPGTVSFVLDNRSGDYSPDNPAGAHWPDWAEGTPVRVDAWYSGQRWPLFAGTVDALDLDASSGAMPTSTVPVSCSDSLARLGRMKARPLPEARALTFPGLATYLPLDDPEGAATARNLGFGAAAQGLPGPSTSPAAWIEQARDYPGQWAFGGDPEGLTFDGSLSITRHADHLSGPVLRVRVAETRGLVVHAVEFWARSTERPAPQSEIVWWSALDGHGVCLTLGYDTAGRLRVTSPARYVYAEEVWTAATSPLNDGQWHHIRLELTVSADTEVYVDGALALIAPTWLWANEVEHCLGGKAGWHNPGRAVSVGTAQFAGYAVFMESADWDDPPSMYADGLLSTATPASTVVGALLAAAAADSWTVADDTTPLGGAKTGAGSVLAGLHAVQRTTGGLLWAEPTGDTDAPDQVVYAAAGFVRGSVLAATVDVDDDVHLGTDGLRWERAADDRPTRVTASSPAAGSVTVVDADREDDVSFPVEATVDTVAASATRLGEVASGRLAAATPRRRLASVTVDMLTATTAGLWDVMHRPPLGSRVRVTGLPSDYLGVSYEDGYVEGVTVRLTANGQHLVTMDLSPADNPPEGRFDDDTYGRFAADGLTLAAAVDADDTTLTVAATAGLPALSTDSDDYPLDLVIDGERMTVAAAPSAPAGDAIDAARAKLADVGTAAFNVVIIGDSVGEGMGASTAADRWADRLQARLRTDYPVPGAATTRATYIPSFYGMAEVDWLAWDSPTRVGASTYADFGLGGRSVKLDAVGESIAFTGTGTVVELHYLLSDFFASEFDVTVDGGTPVTLDAYDAGAAGGVATTWVLAGLDDTDHDVVVSFNNSRPGNSAFILGCRFLSGDVDKSIHVWDASQGGYTADLHNGLNLTQLAVVQPDLVVVALGFNDAGGTYTPAQFDTQLDGLITAVRAQVTDCPVLLVGYYNPKDAEVGWVTDDWSQYIDAMGDVAAANDYVELLDLSTTMPDTWTDTSGLYADQVHPSDLGHAAIATYVADWIEGGATQTVTVTRAVAPTVATAHAAGAAVDVWQSAAFAI